MQHALCNAHHLHELILAEEQDAQDGAGELIDLLIAIKGATEGAKQQGQNTLNSLQQVVFETRYDCLIAQEKSTLFPRFVHT